MRRPVRTLSADVARKIAAGEVIDRPAAIVRELMDNAVDSGATSISVELFGGGIEKIRVIDNGCGMTKEDLVSCARPHATSKIISEEDLLNLSTLGFRGEALASMAAVSRLSITSGGYKMSASLTEDHVLAPVPPTAGTIVQTAGLFENFPARRLFLKRPASETMLCRTMFEEKVLPRPDLSFSLAVDGEEKLNLPAGQTLVERFTQTLNFSESSDLFYQIGAAQDDFSFQLVIGEPSVMRDSRKNIYIYVNGRRIQEYGLMQAIEYGCQGYFPNGTHPAACLFVTMNPALVDFNIHPAKREARFKDIAPLHHALSTTVRNFFKEYTVHTMISQHGEPQSSQSIPSLAQGALIPDSAEPISPLLNFACPPEAEDIVDRRETPEVTYSDIEHTDWRSKFFASGDFRATNVDSPAPVSVPSPAAVKHDAPQQSAIQQSAIKQSAPQQSAIQQSAPQQSALRYTAQSSIPQHGYSADLKTFKFIGCALGTFLIAQKDETLYIIDQHAADERFRYNALMEAMGQRQALLVPYTVQTASDADDDYLESIHQALTDAGFTCKNCGNGNWEFSSVPIRWKGTESDLAHDLLDKRIDPEDVCSSIAAMTACRAAVKDGTVLDDETASRIAERALALPDPHCPHGRPVFTSITREQLFSLVKRT